MKLRLVAAVVAAGPLILLGVGSASAASPSAACKSFADYVNPSTGAPFTNHGSCTSYVAHGGSLRHVLAVVGFSTSPVDAGQNCTAEFTLVGLNPGQTYSLQMTFNRGAIAETIAVTADPNGEAHVLTSAYSEEGVTDLGVIVDGVFLAQLTPDLAC